MKNSIDDLKNISAEILVKIRKKKPLVLSLTNSVVRPITANLLLAVGAAPVMLGDASECTEILRGGANALLVNLGTLTQAQADAMLAAVDAANDAKVPWVLDPVAVGALSFRTNFAKKLLALSPAIIRGNASEILALAGLGSGGRGVESLSGSDAAVDAARTLAKTTGAAVLVTGKIDYATDGETVVPVANGNVMMTLVTGVGCSMGARLPLRVFRSKKMRCSRASRARQLRALREKLPLKNLVPLEHSPRNTSMRFTSFRQKHCGNVQILRCKK